MAGSSTKAILYALGANFGIAVAKGAAAAYTGSGAMLAECIHSFADCANQVLLFIGLKRSNKPPTAEHPLGYGKAIFVWSFVVAILLFSMGGLFSVYEGVHKLQETHEHGVEGHWVAIAVLVVSIGLESLSLWGAMVEINKLRGGRPIFAWLKASRNAELVVVFGEDVAALAGLVLALAFVVLAAVTGNPEYDAYGSIAIGVLLLLISVFLFVQVKALLIGRSADPELQKSIEECINADDNIEALLNSITIQVGPHVMLASKLKFKSGLSIEEAARAINALEKAIKEKHSEVRWCFMEPDITDN